MTENQPDLPVSTEDFVRRIQTGFNRLMEAISGLTPQQAAIPDEGGWSIKDNLAHLAAWEQITLRTDINKEPYHEVMRLDEQRLRTMNEDEENAVIYERNKDRSYEDVVNDLKQSTQRVIDRIRELPFSELMNPGRPVGTMQKPIIAWVIGNTYEHFEEHLPRIQAQAGRVRG